MKKIISFVLFTALTISAISGCSSDKEISEKYEVLQNAYNDLQTDYDELKDEYDNLDVQYDALMEKYQSSSEELEKIKSDVLILGNALGAVSADSLKQKELGLSGNYTFDYVEQTYEPTQKTASTSSAASTSSSASASSTSSAASSSSSDKGEYSYIGNINSHKFHRTSCSTLPNPENRVYFSSRDEAINKGYVPCKKCDP